MCNECVSSNTDSHVEESEKSFCCPQPVTLARVPRYARSTFPM